MKEVVLYNIRSNYNVGAIFRTADGAGVDKIFLAGCTPAPKDRFGRAVAEIHKTALGAEEVVAWEAVAEIGFLIKELKKEKKIIVAVEQSPQSVSLSDWSTNEDVVYIFGSETEGLPEEILQTVDVILEIPMHGHKESLNVSVTAGIVLYH